MQNEKEPLDFVDEQEGDEGRIVIYVPFELKRQMYSKLALEGKTMKDWFTEAANAYVGQG